jgi:hypothetical protein
MGDDQFAFTPRITTEGVERVLREEEQCTKHTCTDRVCIWKTPKGHGFMAPNPDTVPSVPAGVLNDLRRMIRKLDGQ